MAFPLTSPPSRPVAKTSPFYRVVYDPVYPHARPRSVDETRDGMVIGSLLVSLVVVLGTGFTPIHVPAAAAGLVVYVTDAPAGVTHIELRFRGVEAGVGDCFLPAGRPWVRISDHHGWNDATLLAAGSLACPQDGHLTLVFDAARVQREGQWVPAILARSEATIRTTPPRGASSLVLVADLDLERGLEERDGKFIFEPIVKAVAYAYSPTRGGYPDPAQDLAAFSILDLVAPGHPHSASTSAAAAPVKPEPDATHAEPSPQPFGPPQEAPSSPPQPPGPEASSSSSSSSPPSTGSRTKAGPGGDAPPGSSAATKEPPPEGPSSSAGPAVPIQAPQEPAAVQEARRDAETRVEAARTTAGPLVERVVERAGEEADDAFWRACQLVLHGCNQV